MQAQGKEEDQTPIQTSQSLKEEAQNFRGKNVEPATKVKLSAGDSDPLSVSVGVKDDDKDLEVRREEESLVMKRQHKSSGALQRKF